MPESWVQVAVVLTAVMPGFVYQVSRRRVGGPDPDEREFGVRILRAIAASAVFAGLYALVLGSTIVTYVEDPARALADIQLMGLSFLALVVATPWAAARLVFYVRTSGWFQAAAVSVVAKLRLKRPWNPTPSAWDFAFARLQPGWVRVRLADGSWVGGWFAERSFASSFPEPQELYVEVGYVMADDGKFTEEVSAPAGMVVRCQDAVVVDFIPYESDNGREEA